jgi:hypothetical protein
MTQSYAPRRPATDTAAGECQPARQAARPGPAGMRGARVQDMFVVVFPDHGEDTFRIQPCAGQAEAEQVMKRANNRAALADREPGYQIGRLTMLGAGSVPGRLAGPPRRARPAAAQSETLW